MSFRYHLVSLMAAFLALAVGVVVGSAALSPAPAPAAAVAARPPAEDFARAVGPRVVKGALTGQRVLVLLAPDARPAGLREQLIRAGATVTGQLRLRPALLDPGHSQVVDDVVTGVVPSGLLLPEASAVDRAGAVLAATLVTSSRGTEASAAEQQQVYGGFLAARLVVAEGPMPTVRASLVLVVTGAGRGAALATVAVAFQERVGVVLAGPAAAARGAGPVAVLRGRTGGVSDVDGVDTVQGAIAVVLALAEQAGGGSGHYGTGPGAGSVVPDLS